VDEVTTWSTGRKPPTHGWARIRHLEALIEDEGMKSPCNADRMAWLSRRLVEADEAVGRAPAPRD